MALLQESNALCSKRKLVDNCLAKDSKYRRVEAENGSSFDSSAKRCHCCCMRPNLADDCVNYLKSGVPSRIVFYKQGTWRNFPEQLMKSLIEGFRGNKSSVVVVMDDQPLLVDFLSMTLVNLKTRKQRSIAWFDDNGKCFFPSLFFDEEANESTKLESGIVEGSSQGIILDKVANSPPEVVKQVVLESSAPVPQNASTADTLRKKITSVERGTESFLFVQDLFLSGMGPFARANNILHIHRYSPNDITAQCRLEAFERQMRYTIEERGDANVKYGWLGSRKQNIVRILINGFGSTGKPAEKAGLSAGVYLSPEDRAFTSVGLCDVDEKGVQYMLLCRAILGNMEAVKPGSQEYFPSSEIYDSGVDDCSNPKCYVMWPSNLSTHIRLEYLVSFRLTPRVREYLLGLKGLWFHPLPKEIAVDISTLQPVMCASGKGPTSPWISFRVLFAMIQDGISSVAKELLFHHYEELKENKITREEMVKKMIILVGQKLLLDNLKKLHYSPSLWYKSPAEVMSSDPASTASEPVCVDTAIRNCASATRSTHGGDPLAPNALPENSTSFDTLMPVMVPKGHDSPAPSGVPEKPTAAGAICRDSMSASVASRVQNSAIPSMSPETSASPKTKSRDPFATRMNPIVHGALVRTVPENSASLGVKVSKSVAPSIEPNGHASLAPSVDSKGHEFLTPSFTPRGSGSVVPSLTLGNSGSPSAKDLNSVVPSVTPKGREFLALSMAPQNSAFLSGKGCDAVRSSVVPQVRAPSMKSQVHGLKTAPQDHHSCAASMNSGDSVSQTAEDSDSLALSIAPKVRDSTAPSKEPKGHESPAPKKVPKVQGCLAPNMGPKISGSPAPSVATKEKNVNGVPEEPVRPCGAHNKFRGPGCDTSSTIARAADTLVALSNPHEKI